PCAVDPARVVIQAEAQAILRDPLAGGCDRDHDPGAPMSTLVEAGGVVLSGDVRPEDVPDRGLDADGPRRCPLGDRVHRALPVGVLHDPRTVDPLDGARTGGDGSAAPPTAPCIPIDHSDDTPRAAPGPGAR